MINKQRCCCMAADVLAPGFWEIGSYKHNVRRIKEGIDQLDDFSKMARERAEIEAKYGKTLQQFADKWKSHVDKTFPHSSVKKAWLEVIGEADALAIQHSRVKDRLTDEVLKTLALYRKENYHLSAFRSPKEIRETEEGFERAQRKWKKLYEKLESSKKSYYSACRQEKSALVNLNNCQADTSISQDGAQKFRDRLEKTRDEVQRQKAIYERNLDEITQYRAPYMQDMSFEFEKCQKMELKRSVFLVEMLTATQQVLVDLIRNNKFSQLHSQLESLLKASDETVIEEDLMLWSSQNGKDAPTDWPAFEEYTEAMRTIASKKEPSKGTETGGVVLTRQVIKTDEILAVAGTANSDNGKLQSNSDSDTNTLDSRKTEYVKYKPQLLQHSPQSAQWERAVTDSPPLSTITPDSAKYGEFDEYHTKSIATVLYDYNPVENDEIPLSKGETIEVLSDPDSLGWCTGRRNGEVGLFPASYVQVM